MSFFLKELSHFAHLINPDHPEEALKDVKVIVTHIKESLSGQVSDQSLIRQEIERGNVLGIPFVVPEQGDRIEL